MRPTHCVWVWKYCVQRCKINFAKENYEFCKWTRFSLIFLSSFFIRFHFVRFILFHILCFSFFLFVSVFVFFILHFQNWINDRYYLNLNNGKDMLRSTALMLVAWKSIRSVRCVFGSFFILFSFHLDYRQFDFYLFPLFDYFFFFFFNLRLRRNKCALLSMSDFAAFPLSISFNFSIFLVLFYRIEFFPVPPFSEHFHHYFVVFVSILSLLLVSSFSVMFCTRSVPSLNSISIFRCRWWKFWLFIRLYFNTTLFSFSSSLCCGSLSNASSFFNI